MKTDSLNRRKRHYSQSTGVQVELTERDPGLCAAILRHGPLTADLLQPFYGGTMGSIRRRLKQLFHEKSGGGPYVTRPELLNPKNGSKCEPLWYDLTAAGITVAKSDGIPRYSRARTDPLHHRAMTAAITASFEILARACGMRYIDKEEIFRHEKCPDATRASSNPLRIKARSTNVEPDGLFGFQCATGFRWFALECDRATETFDTIKAKIAEYEYLLTRQGGLTPYQARWGVSNLRVMFVTTAPGRVETLQNHLAGSAYTNHFMFKSLPEFGLGSWRAPRAPIRELFVPWLRAGEHYDITKV